MAHEPASSLVEHRRRAAPSVDEVRAVAAALGAQRPVEVIDVGANPIDGDPPYAPLLAAGVARVTGFEPQPDALDRLRDAADPHERYLPHALGDGAAHELRVTASSGFASLREPDAAQLALLTDFPRLAAVIDRIPVVTTRLDDIPEVDRVDLLKIDIQGGELDVFEGGPRLLDRCLAVQTEVGFHRLYEGAPTFAEVDARLRGHGLAPHALVSHRTWPLAPTPWADPLEADSRHLVEADVLYVRDLRTLGSLEVDTLAALGQIAHGGYGALGVARLCAREIDRRRGATAAGAEDELLRILRSAPAPTRAG